MPNNAFAAAAKRGTTRVPAKPASTMRPLFARFYDPELREAIHTEAHRLRIPESELVRKLFEVYFANEDLRTAVRAALAQAPG